VTIKLLYFAAIREIVGRSEETMHLPDEISTIGALATHVERVLPALRGRLRSVRWARNEELVGLNEVLADDDVVALIPPVAGG
jgi:molybdopterin synthase sulfur carrier subunit